MIDSFNWIAAKVTNVRFAFAAKTEIDGVIVAVDGRTDDRETARKKVLEALALIERCDGVRYQRVLRHLKRVFVLSAPGYLGKYCARLSMCELAETYVTAPQTTVALLASTLIHEFTHALLHAYGIPYDEPRRRRIERLCYKAERAFANRLPESERESAEIIIKETEVNLCRNARRWSDQGLLEARLYSMSERGYPAWLMDIYGKIAFSELRNRDI